IFGYSILGMYLFGGKFCKYTDSDGIVRECSCVMIVTKDKKCECDRKHFNDILWATVTVFQVSYYSSMKSLRSNSPPIITHTAATPQDSPSTTLDDYPEFKYNVMCNEPCPVDEIINIENINRSANNNAPAFLKPPALSPPPLTFRQFEKLPDDSKTVSSKIITHNERIGSKTTTFSEKVSIPVSSANKATNSQNQPQEKPKIQRGYSWKLRSRPSLRRKKNRSGSDSEAVPLNNGRDHSQCNGGNITRHISWMPSLTRQNSLSSQNIPQNKISPLSSSFTKNNSPTLQRKNSSSAEPKAINTFKRTFLDKSLPKINFEEVTAKAEQKVSRIKQFLLMVEPKGCMKEREEFSLYIFPPNNRFRQFCHWLVDQKWFDNVVLLFIAMNCITLAMERPNIPPKSTERLFLQSTNYIFTFVFAVEMGVKVVACGMCYGPDAYFTSGWNIMDGSLVIISIVDLLMSLISESSPRIFGILRVFRLLRSLRPLRVINRAPGLKLVVQTLLSSLRPIGNIVLICCTFFIIFGILGVQLFKGSFYYCTGRNITGVKNRTDCLARPGNSWVNQKYNFDDLGKALMSLFVLSSKDGWVNIMYTGLDAVGEDLQPIINYSEWRLLYFIAFILLVGFFVLNMFVGVVVENFHRCREEQEKEERVRRAAKRALQLEKRRRKMNEPPYYINYSPWRLFIHNVVTSKYFDLAIAAVIGLNVVTMATESYKMPEILNYVLKIFNYFFTAVFILESTMKLTALGFKLYLKDKWNQLDVAIVILSVVGIVLEELKSNIIPINPTVLRVMRVMRIARVLKLLKMAKGIRALLDTVMQALPQVGNLGLLFFLLFFIFAALGVELFGRLECSEEHPCQGLGEHAHFANFGMAFLTLFRVATGDNWNGIMKDTLRDDCDDAADCVKNCCVSAVIAPLFFVIFVLMAQFVLVNVVVAVLMKHLEESHKHLEDEQDMDNQLEREFQEKQELEERRELCLALQMDSECTKSPKKALTKVLSLPANFTYNPPGSKERLERKPSKPRVRRQTLHSQQPITLNLENLDDIKVIDESLSDISKMLDLPSVKTHSVSRESLTLDKPYEIKEKHEYGEKHPSKNVNQMKDFNRLALPIEQKHAHKMYGSTKHLFHKQKSIEDNDESTFLLTIPSVSLNTTESEIDNEKTEIELTAPKIFKHDSQESVHRIIKERRKLDETLKDVNQHDIFNTAQSSEERDSSRTSAEHPSIEEEEEEERKSDEVEHVC
ncbi:voltage-dependent T-type calcium channel subunit alpha-1G-like, partial [Agrilus planipennis]|uniref:Voltage-dependent T-type calcium channel subunit alpha-1G-like n=1 Tax=Agrilus planipennis TaxID=224129 RepID=A0A7F5R8J4_AGRPL